MRVRLSLAIAMTIATIAPLGAKALAAKTAAGCPTTTTPFNGTHDAGIRVLNTSNFADDQGPLRRFNP